MSNQQLSTKAGQVQYYHHRSNVETAFSMIKAKFGPAVRSKTPGAQMNEVLFKVLCHNLCCLVQSMFELGSSRSFGRRVSEEGDNSSDVDL